MDPSMAHAFQEVLGPFLGLLAFGSIPIGILFVTRYFKLKTRELELEAELHGRAGQARIAALETRQEALEAAVGSLAQGLSQRFAAPPDAPEEAAARTP